MKGNGKSWPSEFEAESASMTLAVRLGFWVWLLRWARRPRRVFWQLDPITGEWRRI